MDSKKLEQTKRIAEINDIFRQCLMGGRIVFTPEVRALNAKTIRLLLGALREGKPKRTHRLYHEHNSGFVIVKGMRFEWKIEYFERSSETQPASDPTDVVNTLRVLTVILNKTI